MAYPDIDAPTQLVIAPVSPATGFQVQRYGARGITQTLSMDPSIGGRGTSIRRTINGTLIDLTYAAMRKYTSTISCDDQDTPCLDASWVGQTVTVDCIVELSYASGSPSRSVVSGSSRGVSGGHTYYRPQLTMMVTDIKISHDEWGAAYQWSIDLAEV